MSSDSLDDLALSAFDSTINASDRNEFLKKLYPHLRRIAGQVTTCPHRAEDLVQSVLLRGLEGRYDKERGPFLAWSWRVMSNQSTDEYRRAHPPVPNDRTSTGKADATSAQPRRRQNNGNGPLANVADRHNDRAALDLRLDLTSPFGSADNAMVLLWAIRTRALLLCWGLVWRKVPETLWNQTLAALNLPADFPGTDFENLTPTEQREQLKRTLGFKDSALSHALDRNLPRLRVLHFFRELSGK